MEGGAALAIVAAVAVVLALHIPSLRQGATWRPLQQ